MIKESMAYTEMTPDEYAGLILTTNANRRDQLANIFQSFQLHPHACLVLTGSDGKQERQTRSKTEIALWQLPGANHTDRDLTEWYEREYGIPYCNDFDTECGGSIDYKQLGTDQILSFAFRNPAHVYPDRMLNATFLMGNHDVYHLGRKNMLVELSRDDEVGKRIRRKMVEQLRNYNKAIQRGEYNGSPTFNLEAAEQYYDWEHRVTGFKMPVLRSVQRFLDLKVMDACKTGKIDPDLEACEMPVFTASRMRYLGKKGITPLSPEAEVAYLWFLQKYNHAQERHSDEGGLTRLTFNIEEYYIYIRYICDYINRTQ